MEKLRPSLTNEGLVDIVGFSVRNATFSNERVNHIDTVHDLAGTFQKLSDEQNGIRHGPGAADMKLSWLAIRIMFRSKGLRRRIQPTCRRTRSSIACRGSRRARSRGHSSTHYSAWNRSCNLGRISCGRSDRDFARAYVRRRCKHSTDTSMFEFAFVFKID